MTRLMNMFAFGPGGPTVAPRRRSEEELALLLANSPATGRAVPVGTASPTGPRLQDAMVPAANNPFAVFGGPGSRFGQVPSGLGRTAFRNLMATARQRRGLPTEPTSLENLIRARNAGFEPGSEAEAQFMFDPIADVDQPLALQSARNRIEQARIRQAGTLAEQPTGGTPFGSLLPEGSGALGETRGIGPGASNFLSPLPNSNLQAAIERDRQLAAEPLGETGLLLEDGRRLQPGEARPEGLRAGLGVGLMGPGNETLRRSLQAERRAARRGARPSLADRLATVARRGQREGEVRSGLRQGLSPLQAQAFAGGGAEGGQLTPLQQFLAGGPEFARQQNVLEGQRLAAQTQRETVAAEAKNRLDVAKLEGASNERIAQLTSDANFAQIQSDREAAGLPPINRDGTVSGEAAMTPTRIAQNLEKEFGAEEAQGIIDSVATRGMTASGRMSNLSDDIEDWVERGVLDMNEIATLLRPKLTPKLRKEIQAAINREGASSSLVELAMRLGIQQVSPGVVSDELATPTAEAAEPSRRPGRLPRPQLAGGRGRTRTPVQRPPQEPPPPGGHSAGFRRTRIRS